MSDLLIGISLFAAIGLALRAAGWYTSKAANDMQAAVSLLVAVVGTMGVAFALAKGLGLL